MEKKEKQERAAHSSEGKGGSLKSKRKDLKPSLPLLSLRFGLSESSLPHF